MTKKKVHFSHQALLYNIQRDAMLNAVVHRDYRIPGSVMLKHYKDRLILTNPGNFIGGIYPNNILHHSPVARNSLLADLLNRFKLVNRSNLGAPRIYKSLIKLLINQRELLKKMNK